MKYYVEAYDANDNQLLGNLDGQGVIVAKDFRRTKHYKSLSTFKTLNNRVAYYLITSGNTTFDRVENQTHKSVDPNVN